MDPDRILSPPRPQQDNGTAPSTSPPPMDPSSTVYEPEMNSLMLDAAAELQRSRRLREGPATLPSRVRSPPRPDAVSNLQQQQRRSLSPRHIDRLAHGHGSPRGGALSPLKASSPPAPSSTVHQRALEDAVSRVQHLSQEVVTLRNELTASVLEREKCETALHAQRHERQAAETEVIHLAQQLRKTEEQLHNTEHRSKTLTNHLTSLTEELRFSSDSLHKAQSAVMQETQAHTVLKEEFSMLMRDTQSWKGRLEEAKADHQTTSVERDAYRAELEGLRGDVQGWKRRYEASEELWKAQTNSTAAELQRQVDELTSQLHEERGRNERLSLTLSNAQAEHTKRCEAHRLEIDATRAELVTSVSKLEQQRSQGSSQLDEATRELAAAEHRSVSLLSRTETAERISEELRRERDALLSELAQARDVNQLLAVRLKAATIDQEAHQMEVEARRLLTKQNEEMEKQLSELRRTIRSMMGQQQQLNNFVHSPPNNSTNNNSSTMNNFQSSGSRGYASTTTVVSTSELRTSLGSVLASPDRAIR